MKLQPGELGVLVIWRQPYGQRGYYDHVLCLVVSVDLTGVWTCEALTEHGRLTKIAVVISGRLLDLKEHKALYPEGMKVDQ